MKWRDSLIRYVKKDCENKIVKSAIEREYEKIVLKHFLFIHFYQILKGLHPFTYI